MLLSNHVTIVNGADYYAAYQTSPTKGGGLVGWSNTYHEKKESIFSTPFFVIPLGGGGVACLPQCLKALCDLN